MKIWRGLQIQFSCAHFYHQRKWNDQKNQDVFGKCFTEHGHGHDYVLNAEFLENEISAADMNLALADLKNELDHQHLNFVIPEFKTQIPTTENLTLFCLDRLQKKFGKGSQLRIQIQETPEIGASVEFP